MTKEKCSTPQSLINTNTLIYHIDTHTCMFISRSIIADTKDMNKKVRNIKNELNSSLVIFVK